MRFYCAGEIAEIVGGTVIAGDGKAEISEASTNSKEGDKNTLFVPVIGEHVDAHDFIADAYHHGMRAVFTSRGEVIKNTPEMTYIKVENTVAALQRFGAAVRNRFDIPIVGITGSVGKTTTKEMIAAALENSLCTLKTAGNMNSQVGLPRMMLRLSKEHQVAVIEMGMSMPGEMAKIAAVARPECAVITNIGVSHIGQLGSKENIRQEKLDIIREFPYGGTLFLNGDDPLLYELVSDAAAVKMSEQARERLSKAKLVTFGLSEYCDFRARAVRPEGEHTTFLLDYPDGLGRGELEVSLPVLGDHNIRNALAAFAVAAYCDISLERAAAGLADYTPIAMRGGKIESNGVILIDDTYNASPDSMRGAIDSLIFSAAKRHIAVLASMLELGEISRECHREIGLYAAVKGVDLLVTIGSEAEHCAQAASDAGIAAAVCFKDNEEAFQFLAGELVFGDAVLFKGSRGMKLDKLVDRIKTEREKEMEGGTCTQM